MDIFEGLTFKENSTTTTNFRCKDFIYVRGFIKVLNRRATEFDTRAKNYKAPRALPPRGVRGHAPPENF